MPHILPSTSLNLLSSQIFFSVSYVTVSTKKQGCEIWVVAGVGETFKELKKIRRSPI